MSYVLLGREPQNSEAWDELRSRGLGGSEIAAVVGLSPWQSRFSLYHLKRGQIPKQEVNPGMAWGTRLEGAICDAWRDLHEPDGLVPREGGTYRSERHEWQLANPDRLVYRYENSKGTLDSLLEVKTAHQYDAHEWGPHGSDIIPPYYKCQVQWYLDVMGLDLAWVAVLIGGSDYREYQIPYDAPDAAWLREQGEQFWRDVVEGNAPSIDDHTATYEAVRKLHPEIDGEDVEIPAGLHTEYVATKDAADEAVALHRRVKSEVLDAMGTARRALVGETPVLRRQPGRGKSVSLQPIKPPKTKDVNAA